MSAWLVMSAIGIFQVCPGCGGKNEYVLTIPLFDKTILDLNNAKDMKTIDAARAQQVDTFHPCDKDFNYERLNLPSTRVYIYVCGRDDEEQDVYIQSVRVYNTRVAASNSSKSTDRLSYADYDCAFVSHDQLMQGGLWIITVDRKPNNSWGKAGRNCLY